jgi:hypothetical protein
MEASLSGGTIYEEHQSFRLLNFIVLAAAAALVLTVVLTGVDLSKIEPDDLARIFGGVAVAAVVLWGFSRLDVTVSSTEFRFGFPLWHRRVAVAELQAGEVVRIPIWYGIGLHFVRGVWGYNARFGRGVTVVIKGRPYLIGSDDPERLQAALFQVTTRRNKA